mgnify:CR=1 FL=1
MIDSYEFGFMVIDGRTYTNDLIILPDEVMSGWWRREGHGLHPEDCVSIIAVKPKTLVMGTGAYGVLKVPESTTKWLAEQGIELIAQKTGEAWKTFNRLSAPDVVGAFHLTC